MNHVFPKLAVYNSVDPSLAPSLLMVRFILLFHGRRLTKKKRLIKGVLHIFMLMCEVNCYDLESNMGDEVDSQEATRSLL